MHTNRLMSNLVFVCFLLAACGLSRSSAAADQPLKEEGLRAIVELKIDDEVIIARIKKSGLDFSGDEAALKRLADAGASQAVLAAVREAGAKKSASGEAAAITHADVLKLLQLDIPEEQILKRLAKSPTVFTLSKEQIAELKAAGATEKLLASLQNVRELSPQVAELITDFAIVLDCSGSMREPTKEGETKMSAAKRVVTQLVQKIPDGLNVTFVIYGHQVFGANDDPRNCQAVKIARPLSKLDAEGKSNLSALIAGFQPTGATPIALSLKITGEELFKNNAYCGVVLISDGKETCQGNPAAEAARLAQNPKLSFGVHVVGFDVGQDRAGLEEIAKAGRGKYHNADSAAELADALGAVAQELQIASKPADKTVTQRRAIIVHKPPIDEFPALGEIRLQSYGLGSVSVEGKGPYEAEIRVPSATVKYDVFWAPKDADMSQVAMLRSQVFTERKLVEIKPEEYLGMVRVKGAGQPKKGIVVSRPGNLGSVDRATQCTRFGQIMVVPAGKWDIWIDDDKIEEGFVVEPGKLHELE